MATGTVKFFDSDKGFGFIIPDGGGSDVFVHKSGLDGSEFKTLEKDQRINFETEKDFKNGKLKAVRITRA